MYIATSADNERLLPMEREGLDRAIAEWLAQPDSVPFIIIGESPNRAMRATGSYFPAFSDSESRAALQKALPAEAIEGAFRINAVHYPYKPAPWPGERLPGDGDPRFDAKNGFRRMRALVDTLDERLPHDKIVILCCGKQGLQPIRRGLDADYQEFEDLKPYRFRIRFRCYQISHPSPRHPGFENQLRDDGARWQSLQRELGY